MESPRHWRDLSSDPNHPTVSRFVQEALCERRAGTVPSFLAFLEDFVKDRSVLDIGVVEHDISYIESSEWKHAKICSWATEVLGIDILEREIDLLRGRGFNVAVADATSDVDLGVRVDRVVIGDVIEHVESPVCLLRFAERHLARNGEIAVSTPNPYFLPYVVATLRNKTFVPNADHISWITPALALELGRRAGLSLTRYVHVRGAGGGLARRLVRQGVQLALRNSDLATSTFVYVYRRD